MVVIIIFQFQDYSHIKKERIVKVLFCGTSVEAQQWLCSSKEWGLCTFDMRVSNELQRSRAELF